MDFGHYTINDLVEFALACGLFPLVVLAPGYVAGWLFDVFSFRRRRLAVQALLASALGVGVAPIAFYYLLRFGGFVLVGVALGTVWATLAVLLLRHWRQGKAAAVKPPVAPYGWLIAGWALWVVVVMLSLVDLQWKDRLIVHSTAVDYVKHVSVTDAISRTGIPPVNPSFRPGEDLPLYYYYFWFAVCSVVDVLGGSWIGPRGAVQASVAYMGLALVATTLLFVKFFWPRADAPAAMRRRYHLAAALLLVSGLDLIAGIACPAAFYAVSGECRLYNTLESWNELVDSFPDAVIWVPHHVAGLVACLMGILLLRSEAAGSRPARILLAAAMFASSVGLSIWVTLVAACILSVWLLVLLMWRRTPNASSNSEKGTRAFSESPLDASPVNPKGLPSPLREAGSLPARSQEARDLVVAGLLAAVLALSYLWDLHLANHRSGLPVALTVRRFEPVDLLAARLGIDHGWIQAAYNGLFLPVNYLLEFGFLALAAWWYWKDRRRQRERLDSSELFLLVAAVTSLLICTFVRSALRNNDLGWRGMMFVQFVVLLWAVPVFDALVLGPAGTEPGAGRRRGPGRTIRLLAVVLLALGVGANGFNFVAMRFQRAWVSDPQAAFGMRQCYEWIRAHEPADAIVQHNPRGGLEIPHAMYSGRQTVFADGHYGTLYGIPEDEGLAVCDDLARLFLTPVEPREAAATCRRYGATLLVVKRSDPAWDFPQGWVSSARPAFENRFSRVIEVETLVEETRRWASRP